MRLVQDLLLASCMLFLLLDATATRFVNPLAQLWAHIQQVLSALG